MSPCPFCDQKRMTGVRHICLKTGPLHYAAKATDMWRAPPGWTARIKGHDWPVAMFCTVTWYDGGDRSAYASLVCYEGQMVLAEQQGGFDCIHPVPVPTRLERVRKRA